VDAGEKGSKSAILVAFLPFVEETVGGRDDEGGEGEGDAPRTVVDGEAKKLRKSDTEEEEEEDEEETDEDEDDEEREAC